jgi:4-hydroxybenzoate polyprenyltransferase
MMAGRGPVYLVGLGGGAVLFVYQQWLIRGREREACFKAFLNNHYFGLLVFAGLFVDYLLDSA